MTTPLLSGPAALSGPTAAPPACATHTRQWIARMRAGWDADIATGVNTTSPEGVTAFQAAARAW